MPGRGGLARQVDQEICQVGSSVQDQHRNANGCKTIRSAGIVTYFEIKDEHILPNAECVNHELFPWLNQLTT